MLEFYPEEIARWLSAEWKNEIPNDVITGVSHDTRTLKPGNLYVALCGENYNGASFLKQAFEKGAAGALVGTDCDWIDNPIIQVEDTLQGLQNLACGYRQKWNATVIGITGSVGKTTVKEMCAAVLSMEGTVHRTAGNYNNHIGLPISMLKMPQNTHYGVFEIGMNHPGEIEPLSHLLQPKIGVLTDIGNAHRENFESMEDIVREKSRLVESVSALGMVILDSDCKWYHLIRRNVLARVVTISFDGEADYVGEMVAPKIMAVTSRASSERAEFSMPLPGEHMMRNALRAIALGFELGMNAEAIAKGIARFQLPPMRWEDSEVNGVKFINDAYNANPLSMRANLRTFKELPCAGAQWVVVGGMLELGSTEEKEHIELGRFIDDLEFDGVIVVGSVGQLILCDKTKQFFMAMEVVEAAKILKEHLEEGDSVLLKASRSIELEQVLKWFKEI